MNVTSLRTIRVVPYDIRWKDEFIRIRNMIIDCAGDLFIDIKHVGSTSVEGLCAKPIIDLVAVIATRDTLSTVIKIMESFGFQYEGDLGVEGREAFKMNNCPGYMEYHLYVCASNNNEYIRSIAFRDYLRTHSDAMNQYAELKLSLAQQFPHNIIGYTDGKRDFVEDILLKSGCGLSRKV